MSGLQGSAENFSITPATFLVSEIPFTTNFTLSTLQRSSGHSVNGIGYVGDVWIEPNGIGIFDQVSI